MTQWNEEKILQEIKEKDIDSILKWNTVSSGSYKHAKRHNMNDVINFVILRKLIAQIKKIDSGNPEAFRAYVRSEYGINLPHRESVNSEIEPMPIKAEEKLPETKQRISATQAKQVQPEPKKQVTAPKPKAQPKPAQHKTGPNSPSNFDAIDKLLSGN